MYNLVANAYRNNGVIEVSLFANLPNLCYSAFIEDIYPGGNISYFVDPNEAQVFIREQIGDNVSHCATTLLPWGDAINVPDNNYKKLSVFVNGSKVLTVDINETSLDKTMDTNKYVVVSLIENYIDQSIKNCAIYPEDAFYPAIYKEVFGPSSLRKCEQYIEESCQEISNYNGLSLERIEKIEAEGVYTEQIINILKSAQQEGISSEKEFIRYFNKNYNSNEKAAIAIGIGLAVLLWSKVAY
jgi:hypothetical protein